MCAVLRSESISRRSPRTTRDLGIYELESGANPYFVNSIHSCSSEGRHLRGAIAMLCWLLAPSADSHRPLGALGSHTALTSVPRATGERTEEGWPLSREPGGDRRTHLEVSTSPNSSGSTRGRAAGACCGAASMALCCVLPLVATRHSPDASERGARLLRAASRRRYRPRRAQPRLRPPTSPTRLLTILFFATILFYF